MNKNVVDSAIASVSQYLREKGLKINWRPDENTYFEPLGGQKTCKDLVTHPYLSDRKILVFGEEMACRLEFVDIVPGDDYMMTYPFLGTRRLEMVYPHCKERRESTNLFQFIIKKKEFGKKEFGKIDLEADHMYADLSTMILHADSLFVETSDAVKAEKEYVTLLPGRIVVPMFNGTWIDYNMGMDLVSPRFLLRNSILERLLESPRPEAML